MPSAPQPKKPVLRPGRKNQHLPPNTQTIASLHSYGHCFIGACNRCRPIRLIHVDMEKLIAAVGPQALVVEAAQRIKCRDCGSHIAVHIGSPPAPGSERGF